MPTVEVPCIRKCCLNDEDICLGCFRTFEDMKVWRSLTREEKVTVLHLAKKRESEAKEIRAS